MSITQDQIIKIAKKLSKIEVGEGQESEKLVKNIEDIVGYIDILNEVDTTGIIPTVSVINSEMTLRKDEVQVYENIPEILAESPQKVIQGQIVVSNVL